MRLTLFTGKGFIGKPPRDGARYTISFITKKMLRILALIEKLSSG
jgi:hypothetical protein